MIVSNKDALTRLSSPSNLINRLKSGTSNSRRDAMGLFGVASQQGISNNNSSSNIQPQLTRNEVSASPSVVNPFTNPFSKPLDISLVTAKPVVHATKEPDSPNLDNLLDNADSRIKLSLAHDEALGVLVSAVQTLKIKLDDVKPDKLPSVIAATSKVVDQIQRQRIESNKNKDGREVHLHFYTPERKAISDYDVIEVG